MASINNEKAVKEKLPASYSEFLRMTFLTIVKKKRWLLLPLWILLSILAGILLLSGHSAILPAIYILL